MPDTSPSDSSSSPGSSLARSETSSDWYKLDPPRKKRASFQNPHQVVTIYAGQQEEAKPFLIHKDFARHHSPVLKAAFNSDFLEGRTQNYRLDEENEEAIRLLIHWFYTQMLDTQQPEESLKGGPKKDEDLALVQLWILADKLIIPELQNLVMKKIDEICEVTEIIPTAVLDSVYAKTSVESPLRRWFFYQCSTQLESDWFTEHPEHFPQEMLIDMAVFWSKNMSEQTKVVLMDNFTVTDFEVELPEE